MRRDAQKNDRLFMRDCKVTVRKAAGQKEEVGAGRWTVRKQEARTNQTSKLVDTVQLPISILAKALSHPHHTPLWANATITICG